MMRITTYVATIVTLFMVSCTESNDGRSDQSKKSENQTGQASHAEKKQNAGELPVDQQIPFVIDGYIEGGGNLEIVLDELGIGDIKPLQSTVADENGDFMFMGHVPRPGLYQLRFSTGAIHVILKGDTVRISTDIDHIPGYTVEKGEDTRLLRQLYLMLNKFNARVQRVQDRLDKTGNRGKMLKLYDSLPMIYANINEQKADTLKAFVNSVDTSLVGVLAALYVDPENNVEFLKEKVEFYSRFYPDSRFVKSLEEKVEHYAPFAQGKVPPDIELPTPDGDNVALSDLRGNYVLIDFWASWCKPCRAESPELVKLYDRYKNSGFEIYSVSLDDNRAAWLKAIEDDGLEWTHVSDLQGWQSSAAQAYNVTSIPATFLLDPEGRIIARNLRAKQLHEKLRGLIM